MAGIFTLAAADIAKDQILPASITKLEIRENGGTSDQYQSVGEISDMTLTGEPVFQTTAANTERQVGIKFSAEGMITVTGSNMRAALVNISSYIVDVRLTDINGHTWSFSSAATGIKCDFTVGESISSSDDVSGSRVFNARLSGFATLTAWNSLFATS